MRVTPPDLVLWLCAYGRTVAAADGLDVDFTDAEPTNLKLETLTKPLIVIRDDAGPQEDLTTFDRSIGASVLHPVRRPAQQANDLARWLAGVLFDRDIALVDPVQIDDDTLMPCPIASVVMTGCNGPYAVQEELDVARWYMTAEFVVTGSW